ncbi:hypothetical protein PMAYCL1PPCAC_11183, partial [Pristionchus mayeri]
FTPIFLGNTDENGYVVTGPYANWTTMEGIPYITRAVGSDVQGEFFTPARIDFAIDQKDVNDVLAATRPLSTCLTHVLDDRLLEFSHDYVHYYIGGDMKPEVFDHCFEWILLSISLCMSLFADPGAAPTTSYSSCIIRWSTTSSSCSDSTRRIEHNERGPIPSLTLTAFHPYIISTQSCVSLSRPLTGMVGFLSLQYLEFRRSLARKDAKFKSFNW